MMDVRLKPPLTTGSGCEGIGAGENENEVLSRGTKTGNQDRVYDFKARIWPESTFK